MTTLNGLTMQKPKHSRFDPRALEHALLQGRMQLQSLFQILVEPVEHVRKGFFSTLHGSCVVVVVSHAPSMRHTREDLDEVANLWTRRENKTIQDQKLRKNRACTYSMKIVKETPAFGTRKNTVFS
jgi:hypothetical protein